MRDSNVRQCAVFTRAPRGTQSLTKAMDNA
jgi:hypothetical protein